MKAGPSKYNVMASKMSAKRLPVTPGYILFETGGSKNGGIGDLFA